MKNAFAIVGIHTGIGKTIASAVIAEALQIDYWKPVQAGDLDNSDSEKVRSLLANTKSVVHPEAYRLSAPLSPHEAARLDGITISLEDIHWPVTARPLLVETAGGVMSPLNDDSTMLDFVQFYRLPAVLVIRHYLGSINHTLLSIEMIKSRHIHLAGVVLNGQANSASESFIDSYAGIKVLARIPELPSPHPSSIAHVAQSQRRSLLTLLENANH